MKKQIALSLIVLLVLSTAACGKDTVQTQGQTEAEAQTQSQPAVSDENSGSVEPLNFMFSTTFQEAEFGGQMVKYFCDTLNDISGGAITVTVYWGGTLFNNTEDLDAISEGAVQMITLGHLPYTGRLNYLGFPAFPPGSTQEAVDVFNEVIFNNPETSALIQKELEDNNIKFLNVLASGINAFCAKYEFTDLDSLVSKSSSFGNMDAAMFEALGFQVTVVFPPDTYDALQRGLIDSTQMGLAPMVSLSWYEVAPYFAMDGTNGVGSMFTVHLPWWNSLSKGQQDMIQQAATEVSKHAIISADEATSGDIATVEASTGKKFIEFTKEDKDRVWAANFEAKADAAIATAALNGKEEGMIRILEVFAELTDYNWQH